MSKVWARISGLFSSRTLAGVDKGGNRYFNRKEEIDGVMKEKRWVIFKGEEDPTSIPVEWICWLNGQRKKAPTPEEMTELEARREHVRLNVALLKKEEEERTAKGSFNLKGTSTGGSVGEKSDTMDYMGSSKEIDTEKEVPSQVKQQPESSEPTGSGKTYRPGTWQPPT